MTTLKSQQWNPEQYAKNARFVSKLGVPVVKLLSPKVDEKILDLGCGDGDLTVKLCEFGCTLVGIDASEKMVLAAKSLGLEAYVMNGEALTFNSEFDAVFSNAALHWMTSPEKVITGVWNALKPGGRFVAEFGGYGNVKTIINALEASLLSRHGTIVASPWYFPRAEDYKALLEANGFVVESISLIPRPTLLPGDVSGWLKTFAQKYIYALPATERKPFIREVVNSLKPKICDENGHWTADYMRLRFSATKPTSKDK
ncbi:MAG: class I SAM-dependent methyltransferase [Methylophilus sp.]